MADFDLSIGGSKDWSYNGRHPNQVIHFYCSYNSNGVVTIRCNVSVTSYNFYTSDGQGYITINGTKTTRPGGSYSCGKNSNSDFLTATKTITSAGTVSVTAFMDADAAGNGPTPGGGRTFSFSFSVPGIYGKCSPPTDIKINNSNSLVYAKPEGSVTVSWSGASSGTGNTINGYDIQWGYSDGGWDYSKSVSTTSTSGSTSITLPSGEGKYIDFQIRTKGTAGSSYYSGFYREDDLVRTYSRPTMPNSWTVSQSNGFYTINWSAGTAGISNPISGYEIWYQDSTNNSSWSERKIIVSLTNSARTYTWDGSTEGKYYRFCVVALGQNYSYSDTGVFVNGGRADSKPTALIPPSSLTIDNINPSIGEEVTLTWTAAGAGEKNNVAGYALYYSNNGVTDVLIDDNIPASSTSYNFTIPSLVGNLVFRIKGLGSAGEKYNSVLTSTTQNIVIKIPQGRNVVTRFKKDGTVQCVKLVEENNIERENWEGTLALTGGDDISIHNGYKISLTIPGDENASSFRNNDLIKIGPTSVNDSNTLITIYINNASGAAVKSYITVSDEFYTLPKDSPRMKNIIFYRGAAQIPYQGTSQDKISIYDRSNNLVGDYFYSDLGQFSSDTPSGKLWEIPELEKQHPISKINGFKGENLGNTNSFTLDNGWTFSATLDDAPVGGITVGTGVFNFIPENSENSFFELSMGGYKGTSIIKDFSTWYNNSEIKVPSIDCYFSTLFWNKTGRLVFTITDNKNKSTQFYADLATSSNVSFTLNPVNSEDYLSFPPEIRMKNSSVKITKNGFLKCQKLIEVPKTTNSDGFGGTIVNGELKFNDSRINNMRFHRTTGSMTEENKIPIPTSIGRMVFWGMASGGSSTTLLDIQISHSNGTFKVMNFTESIKEIWEKDGTHFIMNIYMYLNDTNTDFSDIYINWPSTNAQGGNYKLSSMESSLAANMGYAVTPYYLTSEVRMKTQNISISKDGIIKCAKLEEAKKISAKNMFNGEISSTYKIVLDNGTEISVSGSGGSTADNIGSIQFLPLVFSLAKSSDGFVCNVIDDDEWVSDNDLVVNQIRLYYSSTSPSGSSSYINIKPANSNNLIRYSYSSHTAGTTLYTLDSSETEGWRITPKERYFYTWN